MNWISVNEQLPEYGVTVMAGSKSFGLGEFDWWFFERVEDGEVWLWSRLNSSSLHGDFECDDDYHITHWMPMPEPPIDISKIELKQTCGESPEQYNAFYKGKQVGYLRLRHGEFRVDYPDCGDETILYSTKVHGDGKFKDDERENFLTLAKEAIVKKLEG